MGPCPCAPARNASRARQASGGGATEGYGSQFNSVAMMSITSMTRKSMGPSLRQSGFMVVDGVYSHTELTVTK